jgi:hypothetical protein
MGPLASEPRLQIRELCGFDLQLALQCASALRKNVEDQLATIDDAQLQFIFEIARLGGAQTVIEYRQRRVILARNTAQLLNFASPDKSSRVDFFQLLAHFAGYQSTGGLGQSRKLGQRLLTRKLVVAT